MRALAAARLDSALFCRFQDWFQEDLSSIHVYLYPSSPKACAVCQGKAFTVDSNIYLADSILRNTARQTEHLLAHEFAHAVQKQRARSLRRPWHCCQPSPLDLEREAHIAGAAFSRGESCPRLSPDASPEKRAWGCAGHYYSVYLVSRLAGLSDSTAEQLAFFAQMPDQVTNLDAVVAGKAFTVWALVPPAHRTAMGPAGERATKIEEGLHCLTGNPGGLETKHRIAILESIPHATESRGRFAFGLGLHALGDSYAHRTGDSDDAPLYSAPYGHLFGGKGFIEQVWKLGKDVDNISKRSVLYRQYCSDMLAVICEKLHPIGKAAVESLQRGLNQMLAPVCSTPDEDKQIQLLRNFYPDKSDQYQPEDEQPMFWQDFVRRHPSQVAPWMEREAQRLIDNWSQ
jgi:hypothetical protein